MRSLDLWIEYVYNEDDIVHSLLITDNYHDIRFRGVRYTINNVEWDFYRGYDPDIYSYLYGFYNIALF